MSTKSKIAIVLVVLLVIVFGFVLTGMATIVSTDDVPNIDGDDKQTLADLARLAAGGGTAHYVSKGNIDNTYINQFLTINPTNLVNKDILQGTYTVFYRSGMCLYHDKSSASNSNTNYRIYNVLDFDVNNEGEFILKNNGEIVNIRDTNCPNSKTWTLAKALYDTWYKLDHCYDNVSANKVASGELDYGEGNTVPAEKITALSRFYQAVDNLGGINGQFIKKPSSSSTATGSSSIYLNSENYGSTAANYVKISKPDDFSDSKISAVNNGAYTIIGPLQVTYGGKGVNKIRINSGSNTVSTGIYYTTDSYSSAEDVANNISSVNKSGTVSNIPSNKKFYLIVSDTNQKYVQDSGVTVTIEQKKLTYYRVRLVLAGKQGYDAQQMGIFAGEEKEYTGSVSFTTTDIQKDNFKITINKKNEDSKYAQGAKFKIQVFEGSNSKGWLYASGSKYTYNKSFSSASTWTTDSRGKIEIKGLSADYDYKVYEISTPSDYLGLEYQIGAGMTVNGNTLSSNAYSSKYGINCGTAEGSETVNEVTFNIKNIEEYLEVTINKKDEIGSAKNVDGAEFKIYVEDTRKWVGYNGTYTYDQSFASAKSWRVSGGNVKISGLRADYKYKVYETDQPNGFLDLEEQIKAGIKVTAGGSKVNPTYEAGKGIYCGTIQYNSGSPFVEINVENREQYLDISGIIWEDHVGTKSDDYDSIYNKSAGEEKYKKEVKVSLMDSLNNVVSTTTTTNGDYSFRTNITVTSTMTDAQVADKLKGYYIKFEYDCEDPSEGNSTISYYGTVAPGKGENTSKALPIENKEKDKVAYIYKLSDYVLTDYDFHELKNMNMGLVKISDSYDYDINQSIAYVKVVMNGYTYTYEYGGTGNVAATAAPKVQYDNGWAYTRPIYPSDIKYSIDHNWDSTSLKVYVVYRIDIADLDPNGNSSKTKAGVSTQLSYVEVDLKVDSLINDYDEKRYELETNYDKSSNGDFVDWDNDATNGVATYKGNKLDNEIKPNETRTVYIQFAVKETALENLLSSGESYENEPTIAKANAYHNYWKSYYAWNSSKNKILAKKDSTTAPVQKEAESIYLKLTLGTERKITGNVFEDNIVTTNGEELGNGQYDEGENKIENIKIDLLKQDYSLAEIYPKNASEQYEKTTTGTIEFKSNNDGIYTIAGVTPGKYYVRFTYGDGTYKIADYKSTIITDNTIKNAILADTDTEKEANENWYKNVSDTVHSTAVDDLSERAKYNQGIGSVTTMKADTALTSIGVENDNEGDFNSVIVTEDKDGHKETILGINFGIIKPPDVNIEVDKVVNNIKITNTQGNIIAEGNPVTQNIPYVSNLDVDKHIIDGTTYVKAEISEEELYGSTLELKYAITVKNSSAVNYYEELKVDGSDSEYHGYYYMFGDKSTPDSKEVTITIEKVNDYIDKSVKSDTLKVEGATYSINIEDGEDVSGTKEGVEYDYIAAITGWGELKTAKHKNPDGSNKYGESDTQETAEYTASRLLSAEDDDLFVSNVAEVESLEITHKPKLVETISKDSKYFDSYYTNPTGEVYVTVTPPTGKDTITPIVYIITTIIAGVAIAGGVILIKKKVLDK